MVQRKICVFGESEKDAFWGLGWSTGRIQKKKDPNHLEVSSKTKPFNGWGNIIHSREMDSGSPDKAFTDFTTGEGMPFLVALGATGIRTTAPFTSRWAPSAGEPAAGKRGLSGTPLCQQVAPSHCNQTFSRCSREVARYNTTDGKPST